MLNYLKCLIIFIVIFNILGCSKSEDLEKVKKDLEITINKANKNIKELTQEYTKKEKIEELTTDEFEKLFTYEYKVSEFSLELSVQEIEEGFQKLGKDRWECFDIEKDEESYKVFCKRKPKTYLRYIPRVF